MKKPLTNYGHSARVRLLALANDRSVQLEYVLLRYAFERFLYRLGQSAQADRFVLKGASAFAVWVGPFCRVTRDADLEAFGEASAESMVEAFREICAISCPEDGVEFDLTSFVASAIKKEDKYPGVRVTFLAHIGGARVNLQCDVGCGDSVYPSAEIMEYPVLLGGAVPRVRVYPRYTVVAEKFQVMVTRGLLNSRLKDYYDLWLLTERFDFDRSILKTALERTFARRETERPAVLPEALTRAFSENPMKQSQWRAFLRKANIDLIGGSCKTSVPTWEGRALSRPRTGRSPSLPGFCNCLIELSDVVERLAEFFAPTLMDDGAELVWRFLQKRWARR